jgi:pimeloyl-ACP methyl ester carboxylesterase
MSEAMERTVNVNGLPCRVWERGEGRKIFWLASGPMLLRWTAFHDAIAEHARLVACSLPGYPGSDGLHLLDDHLSWCLAARDLLEAAGFAEGDTLMGSSTAGALAAEVAALWPDWVGGNHTGG